MYTHMRAGMHVHTHEAGMHVHTHEAGMHVHTRGMYIHTITNCAMYKISNIRTCCSAKDSSMC